ncbi:MAG: hypothetical protein AAFQ87_07400 [Bacteroidota bacterium]
MLRNAFSAIALCLCALILMRCDYRKYDEGPFFSVFPTERRLSGTWEWQLAVEEQEALTGFYADSTITFAEDGVVRICNLENNCREGEWSLVSRRRRLQMIFGQQTELYDIQMLKREEVWLQQTEGGNLILEWELVPQE